MRLMYEMQVNRFKLLLTSIINQIHPSKLARVLRGYFHLLPGRERMNPSFCTKHLQVSDSCSMIDSKMLRYIKQKK